MQLIYASRPFGYDELTLVGILASARRNNERDGITGALTAVTTCLCNCSKAGGTS
jgi:hypothetical protein